MRSARHWLYGPITSARWSKVARAKSCQCTGCHEMGGISRQKELEALWRHNGAKRKKVLTRSESLKLSPQQLQSVPAQLRRPDKVHGFVRPKGLRGSTVFRYLLESVRKHQAGLQSFRSMRRIEASRRNASALRLRFSQSF